MGLTATLTVSLNANFTQVIELLTRTDPLSVSQQILLNDGRDSDESDILWHDQLSIPYNDVGVVGVGVPLDNAFGDSVEFERLKMIFAYNTSTEWSVLLSTRNAALASLLALSGVTDYADLIIRPRGILVLGTPDGVGYEIAGAGDALEFYHESATTAPNILLNVALVGVSEP